MDFFENEKTGTSFNTTSSDAFYEDRNDNPFVGAVPATDENTVIMKVFKWMAVGLGVSFASSLLGQYLFEAGIISMGLFYGLIILELVLVVAFSLGLRKMSATMATVGFFAYAIVNGLTLSTVLLVYTPSSVFSTFIATSAMFGGAALYGKVTNKDLTGIGTYLVMGLIGLIIASIVNLFIINDTFAMIISFIGIVIFLGLTAWDVQKIKEFGMQEGLYDEEHVKKVVIWGALQLYLDFINIFLKLLRFMGKRRD